MKRLLCLTLAVMFLLLTACSNVKNFKDDVSCEDILNAVIMVTEHPDSDKIFLKSKNNLDSNNFSLWLHGIYEECEEINYLSDYAIFISAGTTTYEVAVLKAKKTDDVDKLEEFLERRKETLSLGDKGMYDPQFQIRISQSKIEIVGEFVFLIITDDNDKALKSIEELKY